MALISILTTEEKKRFETPPVFSSQERKRYFRFPAGVLKIAEELRTPTTKVCFLTAYGYFKATNKFFNKQFLLSDLAFIARKQNIPENSIKLSEYQTRLYHEHKTKILELLGATKFDNTAKKLIEKEIFVMVRSQLRPKHILQQIVDILLRNKIEIPGYFTLVEVISKSMLVYKKELGEIIEKQLTPENRLLLDTLLEREETTSEDDKFKRYKLTLLKKFYQSTRPMKVKANTEDLATLSNLFHRLETVITAINLSDEGIRYYAQFVLQSRTNQMLQKSEQDKYLHIIAFIIHQYYKLQDGLLDTLIQVVQHAVNKAREQEKTVYFEKREEDLLQKKQILQTIENIRSVLSSASVNSEQKLKQIEKLLLVHEQQVNLKEEPETHYTFLEEASLKLQKRVSDIIRQVEFNHDTSDKNLMRAIVYFKSKNGDIDKHAPLDFLEEKERKHIFADHKFKISLYKTLFFKAVCDGVKAGTLNLKYSHKYRYLDEYLISKKSWKQNKADYLKRAELEKFADVETVLADLEKSLQKQYVKTNTNILNGKNEFIKFHHNSFSLTTPPEDATEEEQTLHDLFSRHTYISLLEVLSTINSSCNYLDCFQHFQHKYLHEQPADCTFYAGIMALGCNIGIHRIVQTAPLINESELNTATNWYFTLENINNANDAIGLFIDTLDLPNIYMRDQKRPHTASDGQKRNVLPDSLNAGSSYKYFGQRKGASALSFIDERHFLFHGDVINVNEREVLYVIDGLLHNEVVKSYMHSVDMHGYSETIFGATHLLGYYLAPRIKGLPSRQLYSFEKIKAYEDQGFKILPHKYINVDIIREHWDDLLRLIATIKLKLTPASQIFKRLTSYAKQHTLYQALKAFGQIIKTQFILEYIDDVELRQAIEKQLNKVEHSHKFADAVFYGNNQEFTQATKEEQEKAEACKRLIQNAIILWNYLYLSKKIMDEADREKRKQMLNTIQSGSVVTWAHIHLHGEYDFSENKLKDSVGFNMSQILSLKIFDNWDMEKQAFSLN